MSDRFQKLRDFEIRVPVDTDTIRQRAHHIRMRRFQLAGAASLLTLLIAGALTLFPTNNRDVIPRAQSPKVIAPSSPAPTPASEETTETLPAESAETGAASGPAGAPARSSSASKDAASQARATSDNLRVELEIGSAAASNAMPATLLLTVCNDQSQSVTVSFGTAQRYDFEIARPSDGSIVWRWGAGRQFAAVTGSETFAPGCRKLGEESWSGTNQDGTPASPGQYRATGLVTTTSPRRSEAKPICAVTCS